jgi:hypothetical protein
MPLSAQVSSRSRGTAAASAAAGLVASVPALIIKRACAAGRVLPLVARHEPGPGVVPRAQAFAIGVSYPQLALVAACAAAVARRWPPCRRRWPPTTASPAWLGDIRVVEVSHAAGDVHGLAGLAFPGEDPGALYLAADVAIAGTEAPDAILGLPLPGPAHPPGSSPQPAATAAHPAARRHQPGRACADHPDRLSQCLDRHRADGRAERLGAREPGAGLITEGDVEPVPRGPIAESGA